MKTIKIAVWNVNGIRAAERKGFIDWLQKFDADIVGINETKAWPEQLSDELLNPEGYKSYWTQAEKKGYSGVAVYSRLPLISETQHGFGNHDTDNDGRILLTEFENFVLYTIYFPNGRRGQEHVDRKIRVYKAFLKHAKQFRDKGKPVICMGDTNTAYQEIDLARPKENVKTSGFMPMEREALGLFMEAGYVDTFRYLHPSTQKFSYWDQRTKARERNVGWRIDYVFVSDDIINNVVSSEIHDEVHGSDHAPISIELEI